MRQTGFTLLEVLVATSIVIVALASLAQLVVRSTDANTSARMMSMTLLLAEEKMEQLRSLEWGFGPLGAPLTDSTTDTSTVPESATGGTGLARSPSDALSSNAPGYVDYVDANGRSLGAPSTTPPVGAAYLRRWSIETLPANPDNTLVLQVRVIPWRDLSAADAAAAVTRLPREARLISVRTRKAS